MPVTDLLRVVGARLLRGISPFNADRRHIHHILIDHFNCSHKMASLIIVSFQAIICFVFWMWNKLFPGSELVVCLIAFALYIITSNILTKKEPQLSNA